MMILVAIVGASCSDDSGKSSTTQNNNTGENNQVFVSTTECQTRCGTVASKCGAPSEQGAAACSDICSKGVTQTNLLCMEGMSCDTLTAVFVDPDGTSVCGIGGGTTNTDDCAGYPKCEGNSISTCVVSGTGTSIESQSCGAMATCSAGKCEADACIETNATGCNAQNSPSGCCDDNAACTGNANQQGETICCISNGSACQSSEDCCGADNPTLPTLCTDGTCQLAL